MNNLTNNIVSPCVGACSTVYGDDYCRGCKRYIDEVTDWVSYTNAEKLQVIQRLDQQLTNAGKDLVTIENQALLAQQITKHQVRCDFDRAPIYWLFCLLREGRDKIQDLNQYGIKPAEGIEHITPTELFTKLDEAFYKQAVG